MDDHVRANRDLWNKLTPIHVASDFYNQEGFRRGACTLLDLEREEVGEVTGKRLLHLQCHFGQDTLSWARRGARVVGTDFSDSAIEVARTEAAALGLAAEFVCCDLYELPTRLEGKFDIVFTSGGVLCWLPDLARWGEVIAHFLRPGGFFYIREFHPLAGIFDDAPGTPEPRIRYPYFHTAEPMLFDEAGSYADPSADVRGVSHEWTHSMADVVNALTGAGLRIQYLHEFPFNTYPSHPFLARGEDGLWRYPGGANSLPLMFSMRAAKD